MPLTITVKTKSDPNMIGARIKSAVQQATGKSVNVMVKQPVLKPKGK